MHTHPHSLSHAWINAHTAHRRAAGGKFVPPIKRDQDDGSSFADEVKSRVMYGGHGGSKGSSDNLPPELEGDKRLKNIEPRMVELIMNEVSSDHVTIELVAISICLSCGYKKCLLYWLSLSEYVHVGCHLRACVLTICVCEPILVSEIILLTAILYARHEWTFTRMSHDAHV